MSKHETSLCFIALSLEDNLHNILNNLSRKQLCGVGFSAQGIILVFPKLLCLEFLIRTTCHMLKAKCENPLRMFFWELGGSLMTYISIL